MIKYILTAICILLLANACTTDYLSIKPESELTSADFYQTEDDFDQAIAACYDGLQSYYVEGRLLGSIITARTDDETGTNYWHLNMSRFLDNASDPGVEWVWESLFGIIAKSNAIISNIENVSENLSNEQRVLGEAYFIRGLCYFQLVKFFGGVPLYNGKKSQAEYFTIPRSTVQETYSFIYNDFNMAVNNLPESYDGNDIGRATSWAAKGFLAKAYLYDKKYTESLALLEEIIASNKFHFFDDWSQIFNEDNDNGPQALFQIQFTSGGIGEGNSFPNDARYTPVIEINGRVFQFDGSSAVPLVSDNLVNSYDGADLRFDLSIATHSTYNDGFSYYWPVIWKYTVGAYDPTNRGDWGVNFTLMRFTEILMMKAECINELNGPTAVAIEIINRVRRRAGLPDLTGAQIADKASFFSALVEERRHEFCFEYHRWFDLVRWDIALEVVNANLDVEYPNSPEWRMKPYHKLFAIPFEQIAIIGDDKVLWQNPGW